MALYMGIDAGGTKTECAISNGVVLLGEATGKSCKLAQVGEREARLALHDIILRTCNAANVLPGEIERVCIGISGASVSGNAAWVQTVIHEIVAGNVFVIGDHVVAHHAAFGGGPGVLVIAGTGSIAYGRNGQHQSARAGGWGAIVSDQGSAFWIGRESVAAALRDYDIGSQDGMLATIAKNWKAGTPEEVIRIANSDVKARFAELAAPINEAAKRGDAGAQAILERAGKELAALAGIVIARLWPQGGAVDVACSGGVLEGSAVVQRSLQHELQAEHPKARISFAQMRPVLGALAIAATREATQ